MHMQVGRIVEAGVHAGELARVGAHPRQRDVRRLRHLRPDRPGEAQRPPPGRHAASTTTTSPPVGVTPRPRATPGRGPARELRVAEPRHAEPPGHSVISPGRRTLRPQTRRPPLPVPVLQRQERLHRVVPLLGRRSPVHRPAVPEPGLAGLPPRPVTRLPLRVRQRHKATLHRYVTDSWEAVRCPGPAGRSRGRPSAAPGGSSGPGARRREAGADDDFRLPHRRGVARRTTGTPNEGRRAAAAAPAHPCVDPTARLPRHRAAGSNRSGHVRGRQSPRPLPSRTVRDHRIEGRASVPRPSPTRRMRRGGPRRSAGARRQPRVSSPPDRGYHAGEARDPGSLILQGRECWQESRSSPWP